ncbi:hypothetical protein H8K32_00225 [Undibacterium jejuense]|uniref:Uncharacterized protein n=1 Tax=Undibacterium jejuense TaxID=1344949 RepID=A0A923HA21_9BURK|nr:hypothetical protein [Undibacterium jejuense]MBC3860512.1 hypothetical protein [Undibacterium jejuense]
MHSQFSSTMRFYRDSLQKVPWLSLTGYGVLIILNGLLVSLFLPATWQRSFLRFLLTAPLILILAKDLACFPLSVGRMKAAKARGAAWPHRLCAVLPPEFLSFMRLERTMWRGLLNWVLRRQLPARPTGKPLGYLERGSYGTVIGIIFVAMFVEIPFDVLIASVIAKSPGQIRTLHLAFGLIMAYSLVWVLGDRWYVQGRRCHTLTDTSLELDLGARGFGSIPLNAIARCDRLYEPSQAWCIRNAYPSYAIRKLTPFDAPNVVLLLQPGCDVQLTLFQLTRGGDGPIFLYLDQPELLIDNIVGHDAR